MFKVLFSWIATLFKQSTMSYCDIQTADSQTTLVGNDGALVSVIKLSGVTSLIGREEFDYIQNGIRQSLQTTMSQPGRTVQVFFTYNKDNIGEEIDGILSSAQQTAQVLDLDFDDLFSERVSNLSKYCAYEECYIVLWTQLSALSNEQLKRSNKDKSKVYTIRFRK